MNASRKILALITVLSASVVGLQTTSTANISTSLNSATTLPFPSGGFENQSVVHSGENDSTTQATPPKEGEYIVAAIPRNCKGAFVNSRRLNIRNSPNGKLLGTYRQGAAVRISQVNSSRTWALVEPDNATVNRYPEGWVYTRYLRCAR